MKKDVTKYNWEEIKKNALAPLDEELEKAKEIKIKSWRDKEDFKEQDKIAHSAQEYVELKLTQDHSELIEQYQRYCEIKRLISKALAKIQRRYEDTYTDDWDPQGTVGGAMAANSYVGSAIEEKESLEEQEKELSNDLFDHYEQEYYTIVNTDKYEIYKNPGILKEKESAFYKAADKYWDLYGSLKQRKLKEVNKTIEDDRLLSELSDEEWVDLDQTLKNSIELFCLFGNKGDFDVDLVHVYFGNSSEYEEELEPEKIYNYDGIDLSNVDEEKIRALYVSVTVEGVYTDDWNCKFSIKGEAERIIKFLKEKTTVWEYVKAIYQIVDLANEAFISDEGEPLEEEDY